MTSPAMDYIWGWLKTPQRKWLRDESTWKIALKPRQVGLSEVLMLEAVLYAALTPNHKTYIVKTRREDAANELLRRARIRWIPALQLVPELKQALQLTQDSTTQVTFANGSQLIAMATNPQSMRGNIGSYLLDEVDHWSAANMELIEDAVFPTIRANPECRLRMVSTPWREGSLFHRVWTNAQDSYNQWSRHYIDFLGVAGEYGIDPGEIEAQHRATPMKFRREYLCQWATDDLFYFTRHAINRLVKAAPRTKPSRILMGVDLAQQQDYTGVLVLENHAQNAQNSHWHVPYQLRMRTLPYMDQAVVIARTARERGVGEVILDATGHPSFKEILQPLLPPNVMVRAVRFTNGWKTEQVSTITKWVESEILSIAPDNCWVLDTEDATRKPVKDQGQNPLVYDLQNLQELATPSGLPKWDVERSPEHGHGDLLDALMLAASAVNDVELTPYERLKRLTQGA